MLLTKLVPEGLRPWAKVVVAAVIAVIGVLVSFLVIDDETGVEITQAITSIAMLLGVYEAANVVGPVPGEEPHDDAVRTRTYR